MHSQAEFRAAIREKKCDFQGIFQCGIGKRARRQAASSQSNSSASDSSLIDKSDSSVPKGASKKQRTPQSISTPLTHKDILSQSEFVPRSTSRFEKVDRRDNDTDGASANSSRILSPDTFVSCTSQFSQPVSQQNKGVTNENRMLKLCANGTEIFKLAQTVVQKCYL